jgi:carbon storage regulator
MLITRKENEILLIWGDIKVIVLEVGGKQVRFGIEAPTGISIVRGEVKERGLSRKLRKGNNYDCMSITNGLQT